MKCPYRKRTTIQHNYSSDVTTEEYHDCYKKECPFYVEAYGINAEYCAKAREEGGLN